MLFSHQPCQISYLPYQHPAAVANVLLSTINCRLGDLDSAYLDSFVPCTNHKMLGELFRMAARQCTPDLPESEISPRRSFCR